MLHHTLLNHTTEIGVFSSFIQLNQLAKTVVFGGHVNEQQQFFSFPGGQVAQLDDIVSYAQQYGVQNNPLVPQSLPNGATQTFTMREIYPFNDPYALIPTEYRHFPAHFQMQFQSHPEDVDSIVALASQAFTQCAQGIADVPCTVFGGR